MDQHETPYLFSSWFTVALKNKSQNGLKRNAFRFMAIFSTVGNQIPCWFCYIKTCLCDDVCFFELQDAEGNTALQIAQDLSWEIPTYTFTLPTVTGSMTNVDVPKWWGAFIFSAHTPDTTKSIHQFLSSSSW